MIDFNGKTIDRFKFKIKRLSARDYEVLILKIEDTPVIFNESIAIKTTKNQCNKWVSKWLELSDMNKARFLAKKGMQIYIPKRNRYVVISYESLNGNIKTEFINKADIRNYMNEDLDSFDGIDRIKESNKNLIFASDNKIRLKVSRTITQKKVTNKYSSKKKRLFNVH